MSHSPKSLNPPTWLASMCLDYLHSLGSLAKFCQICPIRQNRQNRQNRQIRQLGWPPFVELICIYLAIWRNLSKFVTFDKIVKSAYMACFHVFSLFALTWQFGEILPNLSHSPKSSNPPTWLATICWAYLHLFGDLTKSCQICHIHQIRQIRQQGLLPCV